MRLGVVLLGVIITFLGLVPYLIDYAKIAALSFLKGHVLNAAIIVVGVVTIMYGMRREVVYRR